MRRLARTFSLFLALLVIGASGCKGKETTAADSGTSIATDTGEGLFDAGPTSDGEAAEVGGPGDGDAAPRDGGRGELDAASQDAGATDAAVLDARVEDAGGVDVGDNGFTLLATQSPAGSNGVASWRGILRYEVLGDVLTATRGIDQSEVRDPAGLAFRAASSEVFVGNRHGNIAADGVPGSISRFTWDPVRRALTAGAPITGNELYGVHQLVFSPNTGELFAANVRSGVSRFLFDAQGRVVPNGTIGSASMRGAMVSPDGRSLYTTTAGQIIQHFDLTNGTMIETFTVSSTIALNLHYMAMRAGELYVAALDAGRVYRFTLDSGNHLRVKDGVAASAPLSVAFSPDGVEMYTVGHRDSDVIERFRYDRVHDVWRPSATLNTTSSLGAVLVLTH